MQAESFKHPLVCFKTDFLNEPVTQEKFNLKFDFLEVHFHGIVRQVYGGNFL